MQLPIGTKIRSLRHRDGRTQEVLAEALGVTAQAVSRWESGGSYPDMEMIPSIANYFDVSIDELFGYSDERSQKIDRLVLHIDEMNRMNNGVNLNIDECIALARAAMVEFPGNQRIMRCLASALYNAGYVRYGEYHLTDEEGYSVYDTQRHRAYDEWREAITLYEALLNTLEEGKERHRAVRELTQLYLNTGEHSRALALAETAPDIYGSRDFLRICACDGKQQAAAYGEAMLNTVRACAELMIGGIIAHEQNLTPSQKADGIRQAIGLFDHICTDGNHGTHHAYIARMYTLLSLYLWLDHKQDEAFAALDLSLIHFYKYEQFLAEEAPAYTAPLVRLAKVEKTPKSVDSPTCPHSNAASLAEDWPWWCVPEAAWVKQELREDPRWDKWVDQTRT